jgi:type II secretory pathway pseudopilin PulG
MGSNTNSGFTIIETMLFLGIAGVLTVGILVGSGTSINQQRYRDSVNSLKSFIQQQYSEVSNVSNTRAGTEACAGAVVSSGSTPEALGTSECVILGRFIVANAAATQLTVKDVVGYRDPTIKDKANDLADLQSYTLGLSSIDADVQDVAWSARIVKEKTASTALPFSMLIVRSPLSGGIMTYTKEAAVSDPSSLLVAANSTTVHNLCVNAPAGTFVGNRMAVQIGAYATSQGAIQIPLESASVCD